MAIGEIVAGAVEGTGKLGLDIYDRWSAEKNRRQKQRELLSATEGAEGTYDDIMRMLDAYKAEHESVATPEMYAKYRNIVESYDPSKYTYDFDKFAYDKDVADYVNPYYDKIIQDTAKQLQHTAAGAGLGRGTGAATSIAQGVAQKDDELYKTALGQYNTDRAQAYREYADYITNMQNKLNNLAAGTEKQAQMLGGAIGGEQGYESDYMADVLAAMSDKAKTGLQGRLAAYT